MDRDQILARLRERILRYAASKLSRDAAEDVAQEVLMVLHEKYAAVDRIEDLLPLSLEIARFKIWGARRKSVRRGENIRGFGGRSAARRQPVPILWSRPKRRQRARSSGSRAEAVGRPLPGVVSIETGRKLVSGNPEAAQSGVDEYALYLGFSVPQTTGGEAK